MVETRCPICKRSLCEAGIGEASVAGSCDHNAIVRFFFKQKEDYAALEAERDRLAGIVEKLPDWIAYTKDSRNIGILVAEMEAAAQAAARTDK